MLCFVGTISFINLYAQFFNGGNFAFALFFFEGTISFMSPLSDFILQRSVIEKVYTIPTFGDF
jgi:hypothetical protein